MGLPSTATGTVLDAVLETGAEVVAKTVAKTVAEVVAETVAKTVTSTVNRPSDPISRRSIIAMRSWVEARLLAIAGRQQTLHLTLPAPTVEAETLLTAVPESHGFFWQAPGDLASVGMGATHVLRPAGEQRFAQLEREAEEVWGRLRCEHHPECEPLIPRLYGGFAFAAGGADQAPWEEFGDTAFTLPRWAYCSDAEGGRVALAVRGEDLVQTHARRDLLEELDTLFARLVRARPVDEVAPEVVRIERPVAEDFYAHVEAIRAAIARGDFAKIVAAGRSRVVLAAALETGAVLRRLRRRQGAGTVTRFAFLRQHSTFLGLTPERLISRRGNTFATEALAGSIASGRGRAAQLLESGKDRREHQLVVDAIERRLRPLSLQFEVASAPRIRELRDVLHLHTPISGILRKPCHVLELVAALHPTPAVGGVPTASAVSWIVEHEVHPRGWYAAPVGWFDARGDGEFAVALRSCVLRGRDAFLHAGAGIVRDSNPQLEYQETELKMQALLTAFGA
jgi:isochorismate synthase